MPHSGLRSNNSNNNNDDKHLSPSKWVPCITAGVPHCYLIMHRVSQTLTEGQCQGTKCDTVQGLTSQPQVRRQDVLPWFLDGGWLSTQLGRYAPLGNILGWLAAGWPGGGAPNAPYRQAPVPVNWPEKCTVKALRPQWGSSRGSAAFQPGSCLMKEWEEREL